MADRIELQSLLEELLGSRHVYYQPPTNVQMVYPAIKYSKKSIESIYANDARYSFNDCYELIVIDTKPDNPVIIKLMKLPYCSFDRTYSADNLNHTVLTLFY